MPIPSVNEKWNGKIQEVIIGATEDEGGTRKSKVKIGGETTLPFLFFEGEMPNKPVVAMEVWDVMPEFPEVVKEPLKNVLGEAKEWAKLCAENKADLICLKLKGINPEGENKSVDDAVKTVKEVLNAVSLPLIIYGCGDEKKDAEVLQVVGELTAKEKCLIGLAEQEKYKSISTIANAYNHNIVAFSNLDINLAKQLNILLTDFGVKKEKIVMDPLQGGLGYGLEYSYSVIERIRLAALQGDGMLQMPIICDCSISWNARESYKEDSSWGDNKLRGVLWESTTAISSINAGADIVILRHPKSVEVVKKAIDELYKK